MDRDTFVEAMRLLESRGDTVTLGGGEPTVHPLFWDFVGIALAHSDSRDMHPVVITNGKRKDDALRLARMAHEGILGAYLSRDRFHEQVDFRVATAFQNMYWSVTEILPFGRAKKNREYTTEKGCHCEDLFVCPDGQLWMCGHKELSCGTVWEPAIPEGEHGWQEIECSRKMKQKAAAA